MFKGNFPGTALTVLVLLSLVLFADAASASSAGPTGEGLHWEGPIQTLVRSITGPVAYGFAVLGLIGLAVKYTVGGDMGDMMKTVLNVVIAISLLMFTVPIMSKLFVGAVIP